MAKSNKYNLHLPQTLFPMKAKLPEKEPTLIKFWQDKQIYKKITLKQKDKTRFNFIDGPPYANGNLHMGHALNKILKDIIVKYINMSGRYCPFVPIWDCHGLPIELTALKKIKKKSIDIKTLNAKTIRQYCRQEAQSWVDVQKKQFQQLGVLADWENPLLTMDSLYEAQEIRALAEIAKKKLLYRSKKPVYWCFALQTAIASSEIEYREYKSPSIYVKFPIKDLPSQWSLPNKPCSLVIWTTTPWTLPANQGICLNGNFIYTVYDVGTELLIIAKDLKTDFIKNTSLNLTPILDFKGEQLEYKKAQHPFRSQTSLIILGDHVTKKDGTGAVHTAPGHGLDDFIVGKKYNLPVFVPVNKKGCFTSEVLVPEWIGLFIFKANPLIIQKLKQNSCLIAQKEITHNYPFNPRSSSPVIFRATDQWFIQYDNPKYPIKSKSLNTINTDIKFYPEWGKKRLIAMIKTCPDWCLSRQRKWGVPIPVFYCNKCNYTLMDPTIMHNIANKMETLNGIEYWFTHSAKQLLPENTKCPACQNTQFNKGEDILDVWFDSGVCHNVIQKKYGDNTFPADLYLEGTDQHRGWFQTSLNSSLCITNQTPFKSLITHCFVNDATGHKMSKSKGNVLNLETLIKQQGAEIIRLWVCSEDYSQDLQVNPESFKRIGESYRRFRNTMRFILGNLFDFDPQKHLIPYSEMQNIDKWGLNQLGILIKKTKTQYDNYLFHKIYQDLNVFFTHTLSALYLDILKDRLYTFKKEGKSRRSAQSAIYIMLKNLLSLMSPITPFLSEEVYQYLPGKKEESILLTDFPIPPAQWDCPKIQQQFSIFLKIRQEAYTQMESMRKQQIIGSSLETKVLVYLPKKLFILLEKCNKDLIEFLIVSDGEILEGSEWAIKVEKINSEKCERCWNYNKKLNNQKICPKCINNL